MIGRGRRSDRKFRMRRAAPAVTGATVAGLLVAGGLPVAPGPGPPPEGSHASGSGWSRPAPAPTASAPPIAPVALRRARPPALDAAARPAQDYELPHYPYDGGFTFVRIRFASGLQRGLGRGRGPLWAHDYPRGEINFLKILTEVTNLPATMEGSNVFTFDDPGLTRYPIAYIVEVGGWAPNPAEVQGLRDYLAKGGFLIVDDFRSDWELYNFQEQMRRVLPGHRLHELDVSHEIFHSFFEIADLDLAPPTFRYPPAYLGIFEDDDPEKRLMAIINYNNDLGEYWEYSDIGYYPIDLSNEAYKLSVNYVVYAFTH